MNAAPNEKPMKRRKSVEVLVRTWKRADRSELRFIRVIHSLGWFWAIGCAGPWRSYTVIRSAKRGRTIESAIRNMLKEKN